MIIAIHHTAVSYSKNEDQWEATNNYHEKKLFPRSSLGFFNGYNFEVSYTGKVRKAREVGEITAAIPQNGMNDGRAIHIALDGNFDEERPGEFQIYALRDLLLRLISNHNITDIVGHRNFVTYKSCPGKNIDIDWIKSMVNFDKKVNAEEIEKEILEKIKYHSSELNKLIIKL